MKPLFAALIVALAVLPAFEGRQAFAGVPEGKEAYEAGRYASAARELRPAAEAGDREAQFLLGQLFERGRGVSQNFVEAHKWYNLAASLGHPEASDARDQLARRMTSGQIANAQAAASAWRPSGATAPAARQTTGAQKAPPYSVRNTQRLLNELGYDAGPADGLMGSRTRSAIRRFQIEHGLPVDGQASRSLYEKLAEARYPPAPAQQPATARAEPSVLVADVQAELRQRGYPVGLVDGRLDDETRSAIRTYQADAGLPVTGRPSQSLLSEMRKSEPTQVTEKPDRDQVRAVQEALAARGYDPGPADGVLGPKARDAIRAYQRDSGFPQTGRITADLLEQLGVGETAQASPDTAAAADDPEPAPATDAPDWRTALSDDFSDGNYTRNPAWNVESGSFFVRQGGLVSRVPLPPEGAQSAEELGRALIRDVLTQALGGGSGAERQPARIATAVTVDGPFRLRLDLTLDSSRSLFEFGPSESGESTTAHRVAYVGGTTPRLELVARSGSSQRVVASTELAGLEPGKPYRVLWQRAEDGTMTVSLNGELVLAATDSGLPRRWEGFTLVNGGGELRVDGIEIEVAP